MSREFTFEITKNASYFWEEIPPEDCFHMAQCHIAGLVERGLLDEEQATEIYDALEMGKHECYQEYANRTGMTWAGVEPEEEADHSG